MACKLNFQREAKLKNETKKTTWFPLDFSFNFFFNNRFYHEGKDRELTIIVSRTDSEYFRHALLMCVLCVSVCRKTVCLPDNWEDEIQGFKGGGRDEKKNKHYPSVTAILSPVLFCMLKEEHWKIKKYSEKALQNSMRISLSKLD